MNKKAALTMSTIIGLVLGLLVLLLLTNTLFAADSNFRSTENCPGVCSDSCAFPEEIQHSRTCRVNGQIQGTGVCCVSDYDLQNPGARRAAQNESEGGTIQGPSTGGTSQTTASIQIRQGQSPNPINHASTIRLNVGQTANFKIWGFGVNQGVCSVYVLDSTKEYVQESFARVITRETCTDPAKNTNINQASDSERQNVKEYQITPTTSGRYEFVTILRDPQANLIQSAIIYLDVRESTAPSVSNQLKVLRNDVPLTSGNTLDLDNFASAQSWNIIAQPNYVELDQVVSCNVYLTIPDGVSNKVPFRSNDVECLSNQGIVMLDQFIVNSLNNVARGDGKRMVTLVVEGVNSQNQVIQTFTQNLLKFASS
jgi:hypothetical protein